MKISIKAAQLLCVLFSILYFLSGCETWNAKPYSAAALHANANYGNFDEFFGFSGLMVFPEIIPDSATVNDYYYYCENDSFFDPTCQVYLECSYSEVDFNNEIERLSKISVTYKDVVNEIQYQENRFCYPAFVAIDANNYCFEYALCVFNENRIIYIFTQFVKEENVVFNKMYLPENFVEMKNPRGFSIYLFDMKNGDQHGVY